MFVKIIALKMKTCGIEFFLIEKDIPVYCIPASSFPEGVQSAHHQLHTTFPLAKERKYFGISYPDKEGAITYKAAAEILPGDEKAAGNLEKFIIRSGAYHCITIHNFMSNIPDIGKAFQRMIADAAIDPEGYCLEWYINKNDMRCMVPFKNIN